MKKLILPSVIGFTLLTSSSLWADVLVLKDGQSLTGTLVSRSAEAVVFEVAGQQLSFDANKVKSISFENASSTEAVKKEIKSTEATVTSDNNASIAPIGTRVVVRTNTAINSRQHKAGHKFTVRLEADLVANNTVIAPRGSTIYGVVSQAKQSGRLIGKTSVQLSMTDIMLNNQMLPIHTSQIKAVTQGTGKSTAAKTARLAAIGGLANGSTGAKNMAKVGVGTSLPNLLKSE